MIHDLAVAPFPDLPPQQVVIAGGGTVALLLAARLGRDGVRTLVLESGGAAFEAESQALNEATQSGRHHDGLANARARVLGGTSNLWGGQLTLFLPSDFQAREGVADAPWPISYADLLPYYQSVADELNLAEELDRQSPASQALFPDGYPDLGDFQLFFTRWLREPNFARHFRQQLESSTQVTVLLHAHVRRLVFDAGRAAVSALEVSTDAGTVVQVSGERFVLANGTVEISRLLLASAETEASVPWKDQRWLGAGFQDHLDLRAARVTVADKARFSRISQNVVINRYKYQPKLRLRDGAQTRTAGLNVAGSFAFESSIGEHLQYLKVFAKSVLYGRAPRDARGLLRHLRGMGSAWMPMISHYLRHHRIYSPADRGIWLTLHCEQVPLEASRITLNRSRTDRYGMPLADLEWRIDGQRELEAMTGFLEALKRDLEASGMITVEIDEALARGSTEALEKARDSYHQCGGCRMGHHAGDGVVDRDLRVFGTANLYVAGAAVFRTSSYANPTFTALALAARLAEHLHAGREQAHAA